MQRQGLFGWIGLGLLAASVSLAGCASVGETGQRDQATANVGNYSPAPGGIEKPRVGVPPFNVQADQGSFNFSNSGNRLEEIAADQMTTLMFQTGRFKVIERAQLNQLLREQNLEGIVKPGELAARGQVRGVDYLLLGKVTAFRVKVDRTSQEAGVGGKISREFLDGWGGGFSKDKTRISTELGVDIRLVEPASGTVRVANFSDYKRVDSAESMGINIAGVGGSGNADVQINEDDAGKVLRLAFDDALKKSMSQIDSMLRQHHGASAASSGGGSSAASAQPASGGSSQGGSAQASDGGPKFCPNCGEELAGGNVKFCPDCGEQIN